MGEGGRVGHLVPYGNVHVRPSRPFEARRRFVALVDVLGTKSWVRKAGPARVASELSAIVDMASQASSGTIFEDGVAVGSLGPLVGSAFFSDSILAFSVDDSWGSLWILCGLVRQLVGAALNRGIPLRGAISAGESVMDRGAGIFTGLPLADSHGHDQAHWYRGVGVRVTPAALMERSAAHRRYSSAPTFPSSYCRAIDLCPSPCAGTVTAPTGLSLFSTGTPSTRQVDAPWSKWRPF
jgi:hypothetical protein